MNCPHVPPGHLWCKACIESASLEDIAEQAKAWIRDCTELVRELGACVHESARLVEMHVGHRVDVCVQCGARRQGGGWILSGYGARAVALVEKIT